MAQKKRTSVTHQATEKSKNQPQSSVLAKEILGIVIIALGLLAFICIFFTSNSGTFGKPFKQISSGLFGWAHYLIPLAILLFGCYIALAGRVKQLSRKTMYLILLILLIPCFFQIAYLSKNMSQISSGINVWQFISHMYSIGISEINNGGVFGGILMTPFVIFFGVTGGYIITITATVVLVIYITNKSFLDFLIKIKNMFVAFIKWMKDAFKPIEDGQEEPVSKELKKQPYIQNKIDDITIEPVKETINKEPVNIIINKSRPIQEEPKKPVSRYTGPII
ncbi:MAG TPA: hypothetical protein PK870_04985, partial [Clostridia bacterium]|nr:hypothetical protein [Clostridia bacterium]